MKHEQASIASKVDAILLLGPTGLLVQTETVYQRLVPNLISRLALPSTACRLEFRELPALAAIDDFIAAQYRRIVVLSLVLQPEDHLHEAIFGSLDWLQARTPQLFLRYAVNLALHPALINAIMERATDCVSNNTLYSLRKTAILLGSVDISAQPDESRSEMNKAEIAQS